MIDRTKNLQRKWIRIVSWLLVVVGLVATPISSIAAPLQPQQRAPSSYLPLLRNKFCAGIRSTNNPVGIQIYGPSGYLDNSFELLQYLQIPWVRNNVLWYNVEPENVAPSQYNWGEMDRTLRAAKHNCTNMIAAIGAAPRWAVTSHGASPIKTEMLPEFVQFVRALVERYDGDGQDDAPESIVVNYWEFYNEPDVGPTPIGDGWGLSGDRYAEMLKLVYPVVREANPNAKVVFGGIAYDAFVEDGGIFVRDFLDDVLAAGGGDYFDIMNFHFYPFDKNRKNWTQSNSSGLVEKTKDVKRILAAHNVSKEIMITELGWHSNSTRDYPSSEEFQSRSVVQLLTQSVAEDIITIIWWALYDPGLYLYESGLATNDNNTKTAYTVFLEASKRIGRADDVNVVVPATETNDLEVYGSREPGTNKQQYIAWLNPIVPFSSQAASTFDDTTTQTWQAPASRATVFSKEGTQLQTLNDGDDGAQDGFVTVTVGRSPIYIVVE